jgi:putative transposase
MLTGRRFRVEFTEEQLEYAEQVGSVCRAVWNTGLEQRRIYRRRGAWMNYREQASELAAAKAEHRWLAEVPGHCLQQTLMDLDKACRAHGTFKVRWRSGRRWAPSFRFPEGNKMVVERLNRRRGRVKLPKLGWVKFRMSRALDGETVRSATVSRDGRHWFVSFLVEDGQGVPVEHGAPGTAVGVDRGVAAAIATSDGELIDREFCTVGERRRAVGCSASSPDRPEVAATGTGPVPRWPTSRRGSGGGGWISAPRAPTGLPRPMRWWCSKTSRPRT